MSDLSIQSAAHGPVHPVRQAASLSHSSSAGGVRRSELFDPAPPLGGDRVELSDMARLLAKMRDMPEVRHDRIQQARLAIERGAYDDADRFEHALDKMIDEEDLLA